MELKHPDTLSSGETFTDAVKDDRRNSRKANVTSSNVHKENSSRSSQISSFNERTFCVITQKRFM